MWFDICYQWNIPTDCIEIINAKFYVRSGCWRKTINSLLQMFAFCWLSYSSKPETVLGIGRSVVHGGGHVCKPR